MKISRFLLYPLLVFTWGCLWPKESANAEQRQPCAADIRRFCSDNRVGDGLLLGCLGKHQSKLSKACRERLGKLDGIKDVSRAVAAPKTENLSVADEPFTPSFQAGQRDVHQNFIGGTELMNLVGYNEELFAGTGYWEDEAGRDPSPGPEILALDSLRGNWRVEHVFGERFPSGKARFRRVTAFRSVVFTTDGQGHVLPGPVSMLVAGLDPFGGGAVFTRNDTGEWTQTDIPVTSFRAVTLFKDPVTGIDRVFAGGTGYRNKNGSQGGEIFSGVYDPSSPGRIRWDKAPEFTGFNERVLGFVECNRHLYFAAKPKIYERIVDGRDPRWKEVYSYSHEMRPLSSGLRGLTAVPDGRSGQVILAAVEGVPALIVRIDPAHHFRETTDLDIARFLRQKWGELRDPYAIAAYNDMALAKDPKTNQAVYIIGLQAHCPLRGKEHSAWYLVRDGKGKYSLHEIRPIPLAHQPGESFPRYLSALGNSRQAPEMNPNLVAVRAIIVSPFPEDEGQALYFGGYDADAEPAHNTAWLYRVGIRTALSEYQQQSNRRGGPR